MKKFFYSFLLIFSITCLSTSAAAAEPQPWQDGEFRDGVYEGFYSQLNDLQKMLYDEIKEAFAEPVREAVIEFDEPVLLEREDGKEFTEDDVNQWMRDNMFNDRGGRYAVFRDHPELPWLLAVDYNARANGEYLYDGQGVCSGFRMTGMYYENTYPWVPPEAYTNPSALEEAARTAVAAIGESRPSRAATVRAIHDYLCRLISYGGRNETVPDQNGGNPHTVYYDQTSYNALVSPNISVCNGYSAAFKLLCDRYGIPCVHLSGRSYDLSGREGNHAWNYVQLEDGNWYAVDPTWGDHEPIGYDHFLVGEKTINSAGVTFGDMHETPPYNNYLPACPVLSTTGYPYLEAHLDDATDTAAYGEAIKLSLSGIQNLYGERIANENAGLFTEASETPIAVGMIRNGNLSLQYDTSDGDLAAGNHTLYVKCTSGQQSGAILAVVAVKLESSPDDGRLHGKISVSGVYNAEGEQVTLSVTPDPGYQLNSITVAEDGGNRQVYVSGSGNSYTFAMPAYDVTVRAKFTKIR